MARRYLLPAMAQRNLRNFSPLIPRSFFSSPPFTTAHKLSAILISRCLCTSRNDQLNTLSKVTGTPLYADTLRPTSSIATFVDAFKDIPAGSRLTESPSTHRLCGRILSIRPAGRNLCFYQLAGDLASGAVVQVLAEKQFYTGRDSAGEEGCAVSGGDEFQVRRSYMYITLFLE